MSIVELFLLAVGLSMDAFAVAVCIGLSTEEVTARKSLVVGLYFGVFQAGMPVVGYWVAKLFAEQIIAYDHWVAAGLLALLGGRMIWESFREKGCKDRDCPAGTCSDRSCPGGEKPDNGEKGLGVKDMLPLALATSIDAMAVGVGFAFLRTNIVPAVTFIGFTTLALSVFGVWIGKFFGLTFKSKAELAGGVILVLIGLKILLEHLGVIQL